ncbi:TPA: DUF4422 domain-containing protein, partial [Campylobacter jejuni]|nr:DUF4422 domain-containing protein [Campylobacter jejuni]
MKEKKENQNPSIKILVGYHKPAELLKDDILTPIHLGRALAMQASKDGEISKEDFEWMCGNMIGDDTGDNISHLNRYFCELTGIYWAWKNYDKLGNPDYIGFMHYRRHFIFNEDIISNLKINGDSWSYLAYDFNKYFKSIKPNLYIDLIVNYDAIVPKLFDCNNMTDYPQGFNSIKEFLCAWNGNQLSAYNLYMYIFNYGIKYKEYSEIADDLNKNTLYYPCNMFIMKKEIFFKYCEFLFEIMFILKDILIYDISKKNNWDCRELAWVSEYITTIFFHTINKKYECYVGMYDPLLIKTEATIEKKAELAYQHSAVKMTQDHLSYKLGKAMLNTRTLKSKILLPFTLIKIFNRHKLEQMVYFCISKLNPKYTKLDPKDC